MTTRPKNIKKSLKKKISVTKKNDYSDKNKKELERKHKKIEVEENAKED